MATRLTSRWPEQFGVQPRQFLALTAAFVLMDFRGPRYSQSTGVRPREVLSPLVCIIGQCLVLSAVVSVVLFMRVDAFFFAFANLLVLILVIGAAVAVEFNEVVFDSRDAELIAPRPIAARTYSAARFANLMFYVLAMWLALSLCPLIVGTGLHEAGLWYAPAYVLASLVAAVSTACLVILLLTSLGPSSRLERWQDILAWMQVALLLIAGYGAQLMFRRRTYALEMWAAFPPDWIQYLPPTWLARFVEAAAVSPQNATFGLAAAFFVTAAVLCGWTVSRLSTVYQHASPRTARRRSDQVSIPNVGTLSGRVSAAICSNRPEQTGFWLCKTLLGRDAALRMRCLYSLSTVLAVVVVGIGTDQFENPIEIRDTDRVMLPVLAVYLIALAVPVALYNLTFVSDSDASWLLRSSPTEPIEGPTIGVCKALQAYMVTPTCLLLAVVTALIWRDLSAAALHAVLAWWLSWLAALASIRWAMPDHPFTRSPARGGSIGPITIPLAGFSAVAMTIAGAHIAFADNIWFWLTLGTGILIARPLLRKIAVQRIQWFERPGP